MTEITVDEESVSEHVRSRLQELEGVDTPEYSTAVAQYKTAIDIVDPLLRYMYLKTGNLNVAKNDMQLWESEGWITGEGRVSSTIPEENKPGVMGEQSAFVLGAGVRKSVAEVVGSPLKQDNISVRWFEADDTVYFELQSLNNPSFWANFNIPRK